MSSKFSMMKSMLLTAAIAVGVSGIARADDSSMSRFGGESYADFNQPTSNGSADPAWRQSHPNGHTQLELERLTSRSMSFQPAPVLSNVASDPTWRESHPNGLSERELQALSSEAPAYQLEAPVFDNAPSAWRQAHPNGLSEREFMALSSEAPAWQLPNQSQTSALASTNEGSVAKSAAKEPLGTRIANFFHVTQASTTSAN